MNAAKNTVKAEVATESMKAKIAALLAKANGTDNANEAEAFMAKAMELLAKYQLQTWEVRETADPMGATPAWATNKNPVTWRKYLINAVARYYGATAVATHTGTGVRYEFVGRESARVTAEEMYPFIVSQVKAAGAALAVAHPELNAKRHTRKVSHALTMRLQALIAERTEREQAGKTTADKHALIAVDELTAYLATLGTVTSKGGKVGTGGSAHKEAANKVSLNKQAEGGKAGQAKLAAG